MVSVAWAGIIGKFCQFTLGLTIFVLAQPTLFPRRQLGVPDINVGHKPNRKSKGCWGDVIHDSSIQDSLTK